MGFVDDLSATLAQLAEKSGPSVVRVGGSWRGGSGVVIADGQALTNAHNVAGEQVPLTFADGRQEEAQVLGLDVDGDLAVLAAPTDGITPLEWAGGDVGLGAVVFAVTLNGAGPRVTFGTVSSTAERFRGPRGRPIVGGLEHTAPLAPGSSGSPLLDAGGRIVGINTNRLGSGFYVALPADAALRERVAALQRGERLEAPRLGVGIAPGFAARKLRRAVGLPERDGLLVRLVEQDSPAERAGIGQGDLIVAAGGRSLARADELYEALSAASGGKLELTVVRGADERVIQVDLGSLGAQGQD